MTENRKGFIVHSDELERFNFHGLDIADYTSGKRGRSSVAVIDVTPGVDHPLAFSRRSDKYYFVLQGTVRFDVAGESHNLGQNDLLVITSGTRFEYRATSGPAQLLLVHTPSFDPDAEVLVGD